ncbi:MAG: CoA pyrophosphatase [Myxococcales bacterium]|nr:CoA pyrophosphatase [Myxococcales bacterium]
MLVPLLERPGGVELLFTLRPADMPTHAGQVSFPGGKVAPDDADTWAAAAREAEEELGVGLPALRRVGTLDDLPTISDFHVTPHVAWLDPAAPLTPSPREVAEIFTVPLERLADPRERRLMSGRARRTGQVVRMPFFLGGRPHVIWGVTAAILWNLLDVLALHGE